jgi:hypothetical protein
MATIRPSPELCEYPTFRCTNHALIYNWARDGWYCNYCTAWNASTNNRCCREGCTVVGESVDIDTNRWFCPTHRHRCDALVHRSSGCPWPVEYLRCPQRGLVVDNNSRYFCYTHFEQISQDRESVRLRPSFPTRLSLPRLPALQNMVPTVLGASLPLPTEEELSAIDLEGFTTLIVTLETDCPICYEAFISMRRLISCEHLLCDRCLRSLIYYRHYRCPLDRRSMSDLP